MNGFSVDIAGGEKVGVVGRTGSGKSTMLQVLFDLLDETAGTVKIDGVNIKDVGLHTFRRKIAVIPQTPTLFNGTLRENLDPFGEYQDGELWAALKCVQMDGEIKKEGGGGLEGLVAEGGGNYSVGQKQLLCLARAVLSKSKVLVLDEPSANVDSLTDQKLQEAIAAAFESATIISIAHRLDTVIGYDKIMVVRDGQVEEFDEPAELLGKEGGSFASMVRETGATTEKALRAKAEAARKSRRGKH